ncbi:hypothetical protein ACROYT_G013311 [Oculina patagonica]
MCRSSQYIHSTVKENECKSKDAKLSSTMSSEKDNFSILDQEKRESTTAVNGRQLQVKNVKDISSKDTVSPSEKKRSSVYHLNAQDIHIALETFPEFFPQGQVNDQDTMAQQPQGRKFITNGLSMRKQNLQSECGGLVLWYIREYVKPHHIWPTGLKERDGE